MPAPVFDPTPPVRAGVKTGLLAIGGLGAAVTGGGSVAEEYLDPDESATFCMMPSGVRSPSERAGI